MNTPSLLICSDRYALAAAAAEFVTECAQVAIQERRRFLFVLSGGSTPEATYSLLAEPDWRAAIDWSRAHVFFTDERFVPPGDDRNNYAMARRTLLSRVPVPPLQVFPVPTQARTAAVVAERYGVELARFFHAEAAGETPPKFDLILLGLGEDGHTASLFPGSPALDEGRAWVTWSKPGTVPPLVDRITMTYPVLNAARHVAFLVAGAEKAPALRDVLEGDLCRDCRPAAGVRPVEGSVTWFVDEKAARLLTRSDDVGKGVHEQPNPGRSRG